MANTMANYQSISSETSSETEKRLHESISSDVNPTQAVGDRVAEDFKGESSKGEIETVVGFDPTRALHEGLEANEAAVNATLATLPDAASTIYLQPETVCGADDRVQISPATNLPWRWICKLFITFPDNARFVGTGWLIGGRTVMTAGHCVYSKANGGWAKSVEVVPGINGASRPYGSQVGTVFRSVLGWINDSKDEYDYGAIILPNCDLGNRVGWFGFSALSDSSLKNLLVNTSGYPGDKPAGTQWFNAGQVTNVTDRKIYYMVDTMGGQSGSPVWRYLDGQRHAVGVHAYGGCPNSATRITNEVFNNMMAWRNIPC